MTVFAVKKKELPNPKFFIFNLVFLLPCMALGIFYPEVGSILGYAGSAIGLIMMYVIPCAIHLKRYWLEVKNPELSNALDKGAIDVISTPQNRDPKIRI